METRIGTRIVVYGATGAGKTTFSRRIAAAKGLVSIEMDGIRHERGWDSTPWEDFAERVNAALDAASGGWVCEGNYSRIAPIPLARADTIIWLHLPWRVSFWRLLGRTLSRAWTKEPLYNPDGPRESWRLSFLSPKSILWWSIHHHRATNTNVRNRLAMAPPEAQVIELRSSRAVESLLAEIEAEGLSPVAAVSL